MKKEGEGDQMDNNSVYRTNRSYWDTKGNDFLGAIVLPLYGAFISEEKCRFFGDVSGKRLLEIGCGNGESLQYHGESGAVELWGMDISKQQLEKAERNLASCGFSAKLIRSPMEEDCGIPQGYFDFVYSVYAIGWTTDLTATFCRIASYLKEGGVFIFSWSHPIHKCVVEEDGRFVFRKSYFDESWYMVPSEFVGGALTLSDRKLSTYVNALAEAGFVIERMEEETDEELVEREAEDSSLVKRARMLPRTFVIKARKQAA